MLLTSLAGSVIFLVVINVVPYFFTNRVVGVRVASICSFFGIIAVALGTMLSSTAVNAACCVAVGGIVCCCLNARPRWFLFTSIGITVAVYSYVFFHYTLPNIREWDKLQSAYPLESLADRLSYEDRPHRLQAVLSPAGGVSSATSARLSTLETEFLTEENKKYSYEAWQRRSSLEHLHAGTVKQFIESPGFGFQRGVEVPSLSNLKEWHPEPEQQRQMPQPSPSTTPSEPTTAPLYVDAKGEFLVSHNANVFDFLRTSGLSYVRDRDHVVGFQPHEFHTVPTTPKLWRLQRLELVGILKFDEPVVYLSNNLPRMTELREASTRSLTDFEKAALDKLVHGEDLVVQETATQLRMLGSIRALKQCVHCHHVEHGELLGAFSYQLSQEQQPTK